MKTIRKERTFKGIINFQSSDHLFVNLILKCYTYTSVDYKHWNFCAIPTFIENLFSFILGCIKIMKFDFSEHLQHTAKTYIIILQNKSQKHSATPYSLPMKITGIRHHIPKNRNLC